MRTCLLGALVLLTIKNAYHGFNDILDAALVFVNTVSYKRALKLLGKVLKRAIQLSLLLLGCICVQTGDIFGYEISDLFNLTVSVISLLFIFIMLYQINITFYKLFKKGVNRVISTICLILNTGFGMTIIPYAINLISTFILKRG